MKTSYRLRHDEARTHAKLAALILWLAALIAFILPGDRYITGDLKGADFIQVYALATAAFDGPYPSIDRAHALYERQIALVPASAGDRYLPVYPPTAALLFKPFTALPYRWALAVWIVFTIVAYAWIVRTVWRSVRRWIPDGAFVASAAAAFPPFWLLVLSGQTTIVPLLGLVLVWLALERDRPLLAGLAIGLLTVKPQFAVVLGPLLLLTGQWRAVAGAVIALAVLICAVVASMGAQAWLAYASTLWQVPSVEALLEPDPWRMHSLRTLTRLLPAPVGDIAWLALGVAVFVIVLRVWRTPLPLNVRFGIAVLATVLVSPHLFAYDAVVLVIPLLLVGGWIECRALPLRYSYWPAVYALFVLLLFPTARFVWVQASVVLMAWLFVRISTATASQAAVEAAPARASYS